MGLLRLAVFLAEGHTSVLNMFIHEDQYSSWVLERSLFKTSLTTFSSTPKLCLFLVLFFFSLGVWEFQQKYIQISARYGTTKTHGTTKSHGQCQASRVRCSRLFVYNSAITSNERYVNIIYLYFYIWKMSYCTVKCNSEGVVKM